MKKRDDDTPKKKTNPNDEEENFSQMLEEHLRQHPPSSKTEEPKPLHKNRSAGKKSTHEQLTVDLHGMNLSEAKLHLAGIWQELKHSKGRRITVRIITGKGIHSGSGGPVLISEVYDYVSRAWSSAISRLDENPSKVRLSGVPLRGHFDVELSIK